MTNSPRPVPSKRLACAIFAVIWMCSTCLYCGWFLGINEGVRISLAEWQSRKWINATYSDALSITEDERLVQLEKPYIDVGGTLECVSAHAKQVFGTTRSYEEVVEDYASWLTKHGWKQKGYGYFSLPANKFPPGYKYRYERILRVSRYSYGELCSKSRYLTQCNTMLPRSLLEDVYTFYVVKINFYEAWCLAG